ncbi:12802_t:CDS:2 [Gigaspora rosea]|nr:12802_t:CDS:2 [Gigaspora rosea]
MLCFNVKFLFWKDNKTWNYTPLMGNDKMKDMKNLEISGEEFAIKAQQWI